MNISIESGRGFVTIIIDDDMHSVSSSFRSSDAVKMELRDFCKEISNRINNCIEMLKEKQ